MKIAHSPDGESLCATPHAPTRAACPACGGQVLLRFRSTTKGGRVYFWRHRDNRDRHCGIRYPPLR